MQRYAMLEKTQAARDQLPTCRASYRTSSSVSSRRSRSRSERHNRKRAPCFILLSCLTPFTQRWAEVFDIASPLAYRLSLYGSRLRMFMGSRAGLSANAIACRAGYPLFNDFEGLGVPHSGPFYLTISTAGQALETVGAVWVVAWHIIPPVLNLLIPTWVDPMG